MSKANVQFVDEKGKETKSLNNFLALEPNVHLLHLAYLRQLNNGRAGTASTKTRSEVRGGGKKPWKQKGTGRARAGSTRSPLWVGGGITFGPKPRSFKQDLPRKSRNLSIAQAFAAKAKDIVILEKLPKVEDGKTKNLLAIIKTWSEIKSPTLIVLSQTESGFELVKRASNNLQDVLVADQKFVSISEILKANSIVITKHALAELEKRFEPVFKKNEKKIEKKIEKKVEKKVEKKGNK